MIKFYPNTAWQIQQLWHGTCLKQRKPTWAAAGLKATAVTVLVCPASLREKVLELVSYTYAWKTECTEAVLKTRIICKESSKRKQVPQLTKHQSCIGAADDTPPEPQKQRRETCLSFSLWDSLSSWIYIILSIFCLEPPQNPVNRFKYMLMCED